MKPKILVDAVALLSPLTGIGRYTYEISKYLQNSAQVNTFFYYGYVSKNILEDQNRKSLQLKSIKKLISTNASLKKITRKLLKIYSLLNLSSYDLYWQPGFIPNESIKAKKIVTTVHDFSFLLHKDFHPKERIEYFENNFFKNIVLSDIIITGSYYSKNEILQRLDFDEDKIKVIYHGVNHNIFKVKKELSLPFELPEKFILSVGSIEPRKNLKGLLQAYDTLDETIKKDYKLVLVGFKGWKNKELMQIMNKNNIIYLGFISDDELAKVYNLASLFVFGSFYEGFGLPPLEALACGTPVISSNASSMPEICGDAVLYFDPHNIVEMRKKIEILLYDESLQKKLIDKGLQRVKQFTWEKSAKEHLAIFEEAIKQ
ncbi:glycosyltransferase family 4 protein [Sulfurimonas sp. NW15]|uniref:glycosyltransferase family 4 protein n=1 Tax=Sulfurimonas sp. NW15 TaxID=2922729 RepID=UPI003DA86991